MVTIKFTGMVELQKKLKDAAEMKDVKRVVKQNGSELQEKIERNADFTQGYQTGATAGSVALEIKDGGMTAEAGPETEYAAYVEFGTRFMEAQPFVGPAFDKQFAQFKRDLEKLVR